MKHFYRCHVCNDIHFGREGGPEICPTCSTVKAYVLVGRLEAQAVLEALYA